MASNISAVKDQIRDDMLTCSLCLETFKTPKVLPCLHTFCEHCLESWVEESTGKLTCPLCRFEVPDNNIQALQTNFILVGLSDYISTVKDIAKQDGPCGACDQGTAVTRCVECSQNLCKTCTDVHRKLKVTQGHQVMDLQHYVSEEFTDVEILQPTVYCDQHERIPIEVFCKTCQLAMCTKCALIEHPPPEHKHQHLEQAATEGKDQLRPLIEQLKNTIVNADEEINNLGKEITKLKHCCENTEKQIDQHVMKIIDHVLRRQSEVKQELNTILNHEKEPLESKMKELELTKARLESAAEYAENLMKFASPSQCLLSLRGIVDRVSDVLRTEITDTPNHDHVIWFIPNNIIIKESIGLVTQNKLSLNVEGLRKVINAGQDMLLAIKFRAGNPALWEDNIEVEVQRPDGETVMFPLYSQRRSVVNVNFKQEGMHLLTVKHSTQLENENYRYKPYEITVIPAAGSVFCIGSKFSAPLYLKSPCGITINHQDNLVIADTDNNRIQTIDWKGNCLSWKTFKTFPKPFQPIDVSVSKAGRHFVTDTGNKQIVAFDDTNDMTIFGQNEGIDPCSVQLSNDGCVLITGIQKGKHIISKYDEDGKHIIDTRNKGTKIGQFQNPYSITVNSKNQILVSDLGNHRILLLDANFKYLSCFGSRGTGDGEFNYPHGIDVDGNDNIYICDPNNRRICKYSPDGRFLCHIGEGWVDFPTRIAVSKFYPIQLGVIEGKTNSIKTFYL